jgi:glycoside/pentoside/hexuronide:cation symporter, GPH family
VAQTSFSIWRRSGYALCNVGTAVAQVPTNLLLLYYLTQVLGLGASLAGLAVALPKVWDALVDPMFGGWIDRISVRAGRRGPVTLLSAAGYLLSLVLIFSMHPLRSSSTEIVVVATLLLIALSVSQTGLGVTQFALSTEMTDNPVDLSRLLAMSTVSAQVLAVVFSALAPVMVVWSGGGAVGYSRMALEIAAVAAAAFLLFWFATRNVPVARAAPGAEELPLLASLKGTFTNRAFYCLMAFVMCVNAGASMLFGFMPFANHYVLLGTPGDLGLLEGVLGATVLVGMLLAPQVAKRVEPLRAMRGSNLAVALFLALMFVASYGPLWLTWAMLAFVGLASGVIGVLVQASTLTAARLRSPGLVAVSLGFYLGIMLAGIKLGNSLGGIASGELLELIGFVPGGGLQSASTLQWLRTGYTLVPMLFTLIAGVFLQRVKLPDEATTGDAAVVPALERGIA